MNKARIVLSAVALFALIGGAFAFKAMRNGNPVFTTTLAYATNGTIYTATSPICTTTNQFFTIAGVGVQSIVYSTTAEADAFTTLTRQGGTQTITLPNHCTVATTVLTRVTSVD
ncbi:hypothetical protein [Chitinophaga sp. S165]|uniref:hypothetical protein n=1 Tax=Chitinophaga sp. S165 TaxID=2135462 RepID=UPI000D71A86C|nr:hypothetical protein [Chitinophaga sp. S165]PWV55504.1 hypothetical protein C7475_10110 [Chitinophaga sp. S165]